MALLGHVIQVFHCILVAFMAYLSFRYWWVGPVFVVIVYSGWYLFGNCVLTIASNRCLQAAEKPTYSSVYDWLTGNPVENNGRNINSKIQHS